MAYSIPKQKYLNIAHNLDYNSVQLASCKEALMSYKQLFEGMGVQLKVLKLAVERKNDELVQIKKDKRDLSNISESTMLIGRL